VNEREGGGARSGVRTGAVRKGECREHVGYERMRGQDGKVGATAMRGGWGVAIAVPAAAVVKAVLGA
jgi:hypothetical protein